ncbi:alcohol acetyltransferase [Citricoccus sp. SGAir0253]|uniref:alcohol acetyltransferase n=1 Tax=Citricoccus sp. SGAir0253 TaxID=2567881 RepID=UPI0010CCBBB8|nr:alcohol acetyltransferase [Citricoccus sp. SGAir0253]QCU77165.1 alcohol acetyltransferase [Citricoccus sp. SGAir0253]
MTRRAWVRLDNASNIFLAARTDADPKVFRLGAEVDHEVDPALLQAALDATYERYPLYHAVLRRGVFWYYLQDSDLRPVVAAEDQPTCAPIYRADRRELLFRVTHHRRRISLEVFHALSDGTGALWFLSDLVTAYLALRHPAVGRPPEATGSALGLTPDSFRHYFHGRRRPGESGESAARADFSRAATPAVLTVGDAPRATAGPPEPGRAHPAARTVFRARGTRTPDSRTRAVELTMPARGLLELARAEGVSPTMFLTALFFEAVRRSSGGLGTARTLAASVPVNLRQHFPSTSARNFFATVRVEHTYGEVPDDVGSVARQLERRFRPQATPEALERKLRRFIRLERAPVLRIMPRPVKDVLLRLVNWGNNRGLTVAVSNLGLVRLPEDVDAHVGRMQFHVSAVRPQICVISHAGLLTVTFSSPFTETGHVREFARMLTGRGVAVTVAAARVTEEELAEGEP